MTMKTRSISLLSALIASLCCLGPIVLIILGLGGLGVGAAIGKYHWYFILGAVVLQTVGWRSYFTQKKSCDSRGCEMKNKGITRNVLILSVLVVIFFAGMNIYTYAFGGEKVLTSESGTRLSIPIEGMTCVSCEVAINMAVKKLPRVYEVKASAKNQNALVSYDPKRTSLDEIIANINKTGYKAGKS